jgi:hypothetical protein
LAHSSCQHGCGSARRIERQQDDVEARPQQRSGLGNATAPSIICQLAYDEPCMLIVNGVVLPAGAGRDLAGARCAENAPCRNAHSRAPADRARQRTAAAPDRLCRRRLPEALALNAQGVQQALRACRTEAQRPRQEGICFLYAVENHVVLPLKATEPLTAAPVAAPPAAQPPAAQPQPAQAPAAQRLGEAAIRARLLKAFAKILASESASARESQVEGYLSANQQKALAAHPPSGSWAPTAGRMRTLPKSACSKAARCATARPAC